MTYQTQKKVFTIVVGAILLIAALIALFPFVYMFLVSLTQKESLNLDFLGEELSFINYSRVINNYDLVVNIKNSLIVTISSCVLNCIFSSMAAYAFAKKKFVGNNFVFSIFVATLMIPGQVTLIPTFSMLRDLGMLNTYPALFLPIINAFGVFLIRQFMVGVPNELLESARIDGCGENRIFLSIVVPLVKPVLISLVIFTFISSWNNYLWPLVVTTDPGMNTLTLAIATLQGNYSTNYGLVMAGATLTFIFPFVLYIFLQKQFVEGIALSGIKG